MKKKLLLIKALCLILLHFHIKSSIQIQETKSEKLKLFMLRASPMILLGPTAFKLLSGKRKLKDIFTPWSIGISLTGLLPITLSKIRNEFYRRKKYSDDDENRRFYNNEKSYHNTRIKKRKYNAENKTFSDIPRPKKYEETAVLKVRDTTCFYLHKEAEAGDGEFFKTKDFAQQLTTTLVNRHNKQINIDDKDQEEKYNKILEAAGYAVYEEYIKETFYYKKILDKGYFELQKDYGRKFEELMDTVTIKTDEGKSLKIDISSGDYLAKEKEMMIFPQYEKERMESLLALDPKTLPDARLLNITIPFGNVYAFLQKLLKKSGHEQQNILVNFYLLFQKTVGMFFLIKVFGETGVNFSSEFMALPEKEKEKYLRMVAFDLCYGIFAATCGQLDQTAFQYTKNDCHGNCELSKNIIHHTDGGAGPFTFLETFFTQAMRSSSSATVLTDLGFTDNKANKILERNDKPTIAKEYEPLFKKNTILKRL